MDFLVTRLYADGVRLSKHLAQAGTVRGTLSIVAEHPTVAQRLRQVLVARVHVPGAGRPIPHLHEVQLLGTHGESWALAGYEELEAGPMRKLCRLGQVWLAEPAPIEDLIQLTGRLNDALRELHEAQERLKAAGVT